MDKRKAAQRFLVGSLAVVLMAGCGTRNDPADASPAGDSGMVAKLKRAALAQLCERGLACEFAQVDRAVHALQAIGAMVDQPPRQAATGPATSEDGGSSGPAPPAMPDLAGLMEMVKAMSGSEGFEDDDDPAEAMAAMAALQARDEATPQTVDTAFSAAEAALMAGLRGVPVQTGRATPRELRQRLLTPAGKE